MPQDMVTGLVNSFGGPILVDLGKRVGLPESTVKMVTPIVIGLVIAGIKRLATQSGGVDQVNSLLQGASDRMGARDLDTFVQEADPAKTAATLDALTGSNSSEQVVDNLARVTKQDPHTIATLLGVMCPAVLSQVNSIAKDQGLDTQGLVNLIDQNADALKGLGNIDYILDDVPGISDDLKRGLNKLFGRG